MAGKSRKVGLVTSFRDGKIYTEYVEPMDAETITDMRLHALATPYEPKRSPDGELLPGEEKYIGYAKGEVMSLREAQMAAEGDLDAIRHINDRILGKPKQQIDNLNVSISYKDYLEELANAHTPVAEIAQAVPIAEAEVLNVTPPQYIQTSVTNYEDI